MADNEVSKLPPPTPEHRRIAAEQFQRANQVIASGNHDYGIQLLLACCKLDPANLVYRQTLRKTEKAKFKNQQGSRLAMLTNSGSKSRVKAAKKAKEFQRVLEYGEEVLARNPWDTSAQIDMAEAATELGLVDMAAWMLLQAREKDPNDINVNRALARLLEKRGNFLEAIAIWDLVRKAAPRDVEAQGKSKDLAASHTIARGGYDHAVAGEEKPKSGEHPRVPIKKESAEPLDRVAQAAIPLRAKIAADPGNVNALLQLSSLYRRAGQIDMTRKALQEGVVPTGQNFEVTIELADLEIESFRQNLEVAEERLRFNPKDPELRQQKLRLTKEINSRELALYRQKSDRYPTDKSNRFELGVRLYRAGQADEAIRELQGVRSDPRHQWRALLYLGYCFNSQKNWRLAQRNFEEAMRNLPPGEEGIRKELLYHLAYGAAESGDLPRAVEVGYELANIDYSFHDIGKLIQEWQARMQKADVSE